MDKEHAEQMLVQSGLTPHQASAIVEIITKLKPGKAIAKPKITDGSIVWNAYQEAFEARYKVKPLRNAKTNAMASQLAARLGREDAAYVVQFYLQHNDAMFLRDQHPLNLCLAKAESLYTQWKRGQTVTKSDVDQFERSSHYDRQLNRIKNGKL